MIQYLNGNANITLYEDGTRIIETQDDYLNLDQPLNIDIRLLNRCSNGYNLKTGKAVCDFCHESQNTTGPECDYPLLMSKLEGLTPGVELAIGGNELTIGLLSFIEWCYHKGFIINLTVNQVHLASFSSNLKELIGKGFIKGLGISYRSSNIQIDPFFIGYEHSILHCIIGLNTVEEVLETPFNKILLLGYKQHGSGIDYYSLFSSSINKCIRDWQMYLPKLFGKKHLSFDNLAIEQLKVDRFFSPEDWNTFYQGEESIYLNAVEGYYAPSSRTNEGKANWESVSLKDYYKTFKVLLCKLLN